jgi:hypothetical protein
MYVYIISCTKVIFFIHLDVGMGVAVGAGALVLGGTTIFN